MDASVAYHHIDTEGALIRLFHFENGGKDSHAGEKSEIDIHHL